MQKLKKNCPRAIAILLSLMMMVVFVPTFAFAADGGSITVFLTVSDQGELAQSNDGSPMAWKEVKVTDLDNDGAYSFDEALVAAHEAYNDPAGYDAGSSFPQKVWGVEAGGSFLFFINGEGLPTSVVDDTVKEGDYLTAAILADQDFYSDWYSTFDVNEKTVYAGETVALTLKGHYGMAWTDQDKQNIPLSGVKVLDTAGKELGTTDASGKANISFNEPGTYIVTADGVVKDHAVAGYAIPGGQTEAGKYICCISGVDPDDPDETMMYYLFTEENNGDGPYPLGDIRMMDMYDYFDLDNPESINWVYASEYYSQTSCVFQLVSQYIMAPACIVTVKPAEAVQPAAPAQPSEVKDLPAVKITKAKKAKKAFTVKWKKVSKKNKKKIAGIEVQYSLTKSFSNPITKTAKKTKTSLKVKKLSAKTNYYVRVRAYKNENGVKHISAWSKVKKVKTK